MLGQITSFLILLISITLSQAFGQTVSGSQNNATDPNYVLILGDTIALQVIDEPELSASLLVDKDGQIRTPLIGDLVIAGMNVRAAERFLENSYVEKELLKRPQVRINVLNYAPRFITLFGAVKAPGKVNIGRDLNTVDIVDAISMAGGFTNVARKDVVTVIRTDVSGKEETFIVDVEAMMSAKRPTDKPRSFDLRPGDRLMIKERVF